MKNKYILGVDIGATAVKLGVVAINGKVISKTSFPAKRLVSKKRFIKNLARQIKYLMLYNKLSKGDIVGIGIGICGIVNFDKGVVYNLTNIKGIKNLPLKKMLGKFFNLPIYVDNDANAFANGQLKWGKAKGKNSAICVTLGSGVGGGLIINGKVYRGNKYLAGEIGHICIDVNGPRCGCGNKGCLEAFIGSKYIVNRVIAQLKKIKKSALEKIAKGKLSNITPEIITIAAKKGDRLSIKIWRETAAYLGAGLGGLINVLNPQIIIIGGGISKAGKFIFNPLKEQLKKRAMKQHLKALDIARADFADQAGIIGAASLVITR